jgi:hypothetical protein
MSQTSVVSAIEKALRAWSSVVQVDFTRTSKAGLNNSLDFTFKTIDGAGGILGQGYFPKDVNPAKVAGDVQFDSAEKWEIGNAKGAAAIDFTIVAVHEIGHALCLQHSSVRSAIMYPSVSATQQFVALATNDISAIRKLYASRGTARSSLIEEPAQKPQSAAATDGEDHYRVMVGGQPAFRDSLVAAEPITNSTSRPHGDHPDFDHLHDGGIDASMALGHNDKLDAASVDEVFRHSLAASYDEFLDSGFGRPSKRRFAIG